jgi:hypothetical protein
MVRVCDKDDVYEALWYRMNVEFRRSVAFFDRKSIKEVLEIRQNPCSERGLVEITVARACDLQAHAR